MKNIWHDNHFSRDFTREVLSDSELSHLCQTTTRRAKRRRFAAQVRGASLLAALAIVGWLSLRPTPPQTAETAPAKPERPFTLVRSEVFTNMIATQLLDSASFFASLEPMTVITSPEVPAYKLISDEQLLRFFEGHAVALVRLPEGKMELQFLDQPANSSEAQ